MNFRFKKSAITLFILSMTIFASATEKIASPKIQIRVPKPDLIIEFIKFNPAAPVVGETIHFEVTVANIGTVRSGNCKLTFAIGGESIPAAAIVPPLNPGQRWTYTRDYTHTRALRYRATAIVDTANAVAESNELNNKKYIDYSVAAERKPDLIVESVTAEPSSIFSYQSSVITVKFKNIGTASTGGPWNGALHINGVVVKSEAMPILAPGATAQITFTFGPTNEANPEHRHLKGVADTDNAVNESNEANNEKEGILYVAS